MLRCGVQRIPYDVIARCGASDAYDSIRGMRIRNCEFIALVVGVACCLAEYAAAFPTCEVRVKRGGPAIVIDDQPYAPIFFAGNSQFGRDEILAEQVKLAGSAGINLVSLNNFLHAPMDEILGRLALFEKANLNAYFYLHVWVGPPQDWVTAHPEQCITKADGSRINMASPSSELWQALTIEKLEAFVSALEDSRFRSRIIGLSLDYLNTGEWFYPDTNDFTDYSEANLAAFRKWLKTTYKSNSKLTKAWLGDADGGVGLDFDTVTFPTSETRDQAAWGVFRGLPVHQSAIDMQRFQSDTIANVIALYASTVKKASKGRLLVGAFYGYTMELNANGPRALANSGHLALHRLLESPDINIVQAPISYFERGLGQPGHFHFPVDSITLHGKLPILEDDTFTHLSPPPEDPVVPGHPDRAKTLQETLSLTRRNIGNALGHGCGLWYFDLYSTGAWNDSEFWSSTTLSRRIAAELRDNPPFEPQIAVVVDEDSPNWLQATTQPLLYQSLYAWRTELDRIGAPVGYYLQSDLPRLPEGIKLLIMANPYLLTDSQLDAINRFLKRGATVAVTYAPNIIGPNGTDMEHMERFVKMGLEARLDEGRLSFESIDTGEVVDIADVMISPRIIVRAKDVHVLAKYSGTDDVAAAARPEGKGVMVYTGVPRLSVGLLRLLCTRSGVHLYTDAPGMTAVVGDYLIIHTGAAAKVRFQWPHECQTIERLVPYSSLAIASNSQTWTDTLEQNTTAIYHCLVPHLASRTAGTR